jgi:hypothetical protein
MDDEIEIKIQQKIDDIVYLVFDNIYDAIKRNDKHDIDYWIDKIRIISHEE